MIKKREKLIKIIVDKIPNEAKECKYLKEKKYD